MKRVLMVAHDYPPKNSSGVYRPTKFSKYLPQFGWIPVVLTADKSYHPKPIDQSMLSEVNHVQVESAGMFTHEDFVRLWRRLGIVLWPILFLFKKDPDWFAEALRWRQSQWLCPDYACTWIIPAIFKGLRLILKTRPDVIYATSPPHSSLIVGTVLSKLTGTPFVADFRDLWMDNFDRRPASRWKEWLDPKLERFVVSAAAYVVTTTEGSRLTLASKYDNQPPEKFITIYNGFDPSDLPSLGRQQDPSGTMKICHVGSLYGKRDPRPFLEALDAVLEEFPDLYKSLRVRFIGRLSEFASEFKIREKQGIVEATGAVPHMEATKELIGADALLLIMEEGAEVVVPGKIFEYFATNKPILACVPTSGEAAQLLKEYGASEIIDLNNKEAIKMAIIKSYEAWNEGNLERKCNRTFVERFDRRELTKKLSAVFYECI